MAFPPMMLNSTLPGVVLPLSRPASSPSAYSRPQSASGAAEIQSYLNMSDNHLSDNPYQSTYTSRPGAALPHSRQSSNASATSYSLASASTGLASPADSPPSNPGFKHPISNLGPVPRTTIRRARTGTSPYPREPHIHSGSDVYSSSSEAEDLQMYLPTHHHQPQTPDHYANMSNMYMHPSVAHIDPISIQQHHHNQGSNAPPAAYGRPMSADHNLEQLASNVRSATTTSASDRAKQIFVHAW